MMPFPPVGSIGFFQSGMGPAITTFADRECTTAHTHPVQADANGRFPAIWFDPEITNNPHWYNEIDAQLYTTHGHIIARFHPIGIDLILQDRAYFGPR